MNAIVFLTRETFKGHHQPRQCIPVFLHEFQRRI